MRAKNPAVSVVTIDPSQAGLTVKQAAVYTALSPWRLRMAVWEGRLPAHKDGKSLIILRRDLDEFLPSLPPVEPSKAPWLAKRSGKAA